MDSWEKFDESTLPPKEAFYSTINLEDISDEDYAYAQKVWDVFEVRNCGKYHDFMFKVIHYCLHMYLKILVISVLKYMDLILYIVSAPGLAWQACFKKTEVKLELLTDYDMRLMTEKGIRGRICQAMHRYAKANNKYMKNYDKNNES